MSSSCAEKKENKRLIVTWLALLVLTSVSVVLVETATAYSISSTVISGVLVCFVIALKGQLVIDNLIGLRLANKNIRRVMLSYFYVLPLLIALGIAFPDIIVSMTTTDP